MHASSLLREHSVLRCPVSNQHPSRFVLHRRRASAAAVCAQEPATPHSAADTQGIGNSEPYTQQQQEDVGTHNPLPASRWRDGGSSPYLPAAPGAASGPAGTRGGHTAAASCPEAFLSRSIQTANSWPELAAVLISYGKGMPSSTSAIQQQSPKLQQRPGRHELQQQQEVSAALKQLNGKHLARLLKALARLQPPAHSHHPPPAAAASPGSVSGGSSSKLPSTAAARWSRHDQQSFWTFTQLAVSECLEQLPSLSAWELSSTLWASCKLAHAPPAFQLRRLLQQLTEPSILASASAQDLSMALYAVASLAVQVPEQQLEVLLGASAGCLQEAAPQALSNTLWAVATLQHRPTEGWLRQMEAHCTSILDSTQQQQQWQGLQEPTEPPQAQHIQQTWQQQQRQRQRQPWSSARFSPLGLYHLLWAMAKLQWQPAPAFQAGFWPASLSQLQHMSPHGTSGILWAAASLALQPPGPWAIAWLSRLQQQMQQRRCGPQDLANALWAVVRLGLRPGSAWLDDALRATQAVLASAGTQELSNILWSFAKLGVRPDASWMQGWLLAMQPRMSSYCAPALASSAYALAVLHFRPPRSWVQTLVFESQRQMPAFGAQELSNLVWALAVLGVRPPAAWFKDFQVQAIHESGTFNAQELSIIFWSLAKLQHTPPAKWVAHLLREGLEVAGGLQAQSLVLLLGSLTRWNLPEMHTAGHYRILLPRYWAAAQQLLPQCNLQYLTVLYGARAKLGQLPTRDWSRSFWRAVLHTLEQVATGQQLIAGHAAAHSDGRPDAASLAIASSSSCAGTSRDCGTSSSNRTRSSSQGSSAAAHASLQEQQESEAAAAAALQVFPQGVLQPSVVAELLWSAGKLWQQAPVPWGCLRLLLAAAVTVMPHCSFAGLTAIGLGLMSMLRGMKLTAAQRARRLLRVRRHRSAGLQRRQLAGPSSRGRGSSRPTLHSKQQGVLGSRGSQHRSIFIRKRSAGRNVSRGRTRQAAARLTPDRLRQIAAPLWSAWFDRSSQLLLQARESPVQPGGSAASILLPHQQQQQPVQQQQRVQGQVELCCFQVSLQLRVVAAWRSQAPPAWVDAVLGFLQDRTAQCSSEELSWVLLDLLKVLQHTTPCRDISLPQGFVSAVLSRARVLHAVDGKGWQQPQMQRLQSAFRRLRAAGAVSQAEWQQWVLLLRLWRANQGMVGA